MSHIDKESLLDYKFDLLDDDRKQEVAEHLEGCDECRNALDAIVGQFGQLDLIRDHTAEISADLMASVTAMATEKLNTLDTTADGAPPAVDEASDASPSNADDATSPKPFPTWRVLLAAAACLAVAAYVAFGPGGPQPGPVSVAENEQGASSAEQTSEKVGKTDKPNAAVDAKREGTTEDERLAKKEVRKEGDDSLAGTGTTKGGLVDDYAKTGASNEFAALEQPYFEPGSNIELNVLPRRDNVQLTIYNGEDLTLVRERRKLTMKRGWNWLQYMWKNTLIDPTSLELKPIGVDGKVDVVQLVFPPRMTGVGRWLIKSEVSGQIECEITYFTSGIGWRAFYEATLTPDESKMQLVPYVRVDNRSGEEYDDAQTRLVVGQVNVYENIADLARRQYAYGRPIGERMFPESFDDAEFSLGDADKDSVPSAPMFGAMPGKGSAERAKQVIKEGLSEYQLYTIEGRETIPNRWGKRLRASEPATVPVKNLYKYDEDRWGQWVMRFLSFKNDKDHKLGDAPLPDGAVRVYGTVKASNNSRVRSPSSLTYVGATETKYIPVGEDAELDLGLAEKVMVKPKLMKTTTRNFAFDGWGNVAGWDEVQNWTIKLTNSRPVPVDLELTRNFNSKYWTLTQNNAGVTYEKHDLSHGRFTLTLKAGEKKDLTYELIRKHGTNQKQGRK